MFRSLTQKLGSYRHSCSNSLLHYTFNTDIKNSCKNSAKISIKGYLYLQLRFPHITFLLIHFDKTGGFVKYRDITILFNMGARNLKISWNLARKKHMVLLTRWRSWLRHCTKSRKIAGSIPDGVTEIFHWHNPSGRTMALELTQPLTEMSTKNISWG
jgi:hypothetical protein